MTKPVGLKAILQQPIPDQAVAHQLKQKYRQYPLLDGPRNEEPLVDIALYGIAGQSYYSRPNNATGVPVPGVDPVIRVRKSVAEQLAAINHALQISDEVQDLFGGRAVELYVEEGTRTLILQRRLYDEVFPAFVETHQPKLSRKEVLAERDRMIANPATTNGAPPHATGAAIDICLRYAHPDLAFVPKAGVPMSRRHGNTGHSIVANPDYYEHKETLTKTDEQLQRNRRIFYWIMRGALLQDDSGFVCNPDEWWHWSYGDQMWAALTLAPAAFFDIIDA